MHIYIFPSLLNRISFQSQYLQAAMLHFYLSPLTADSHRPQPITAERTSMSWQICERRERLHPHVAFWKMPTRTVWSSDEPGVSMRTGLIVSQHGLISLSLTHCHSLCLETPSSFWLSRRALLFLLSKQIALLSNWDPLSFSPLLRCTAYFFGRHFALYQANLFSVSYTVQKSGTTIWGVTTTEGLSHIEWCPSMDGADVQT